MRVQEAGGTGDLPFLFDAGKGVKIQGAEGIMRHLFQFYISCDE